MSESDIDNMSDTSAHIYCCAWWVTQYYLMDKDNIDKYVSIKSFSVADKGGIVFW